METVRKLSVASVRRRILLEALDLADGQQAVTRCAHCRWSYRGLIRDGKRAYEFHRENCRARVEA
jgi:hypothetical protein